MDNNLIELIENKNLIVGKIKYIGEFALFERLNLKDALKLSSDELAFATPSMGRGIFKIDKNGQIINIKGVDSHLDNSENAIKDLLYAKCQYIITDGAFDYIDSTHPINLIIYPGKRVDIRIRGTSPLEDLEIEADVNSRLKEKGIMVPTITSIKEYPIDIAKKLGLPIKIPTKPTDKQIEASYSEQDNERKERLHKAFGDRYVEAETIGFRPEFMVEFFNRLHLTENLKFIDFANDNGMIIKQFTDAIDSSYELGQRYGQTTRIVKSPYRISDLEYYLNKQDVQSLNRIANYTQIYLNEPLPFELIFAKQMGFNVATLMNSGWITSNMLHRQDYSILGEMCDDSYMDLGLELSNIESQISLNQDDQPLINKLNALKEDYLEHFCLQFMHFSSCIKILQDEMILRKIPENLVNKCMNEFLNAFTQTIDFNQIGHSLGIKPYTAKRYFFDMLSKKDFAKEMAKSRRKNGFVYDEQTMISQQGFNEFYNVQANNLAKRMNINLDNEFNIVQHIINMEDDEIEDFIYSRCVFLEKNATEHRDELSSFNVSCSRIDGRRESPEVIGYIPYSTRIKFDQNDPVGFNIDDVELYKMIIKFIRETKTEYLINEGNLNNDSIIRLVQATIINYFGLNPTTENRDKLYSDKSQESSAFSIKEFKKSETAMSAERSATAQNLLSFLGYNSMLIYGYISKKDETMNSNYCFNILTSNSKAKLIDFSNPEIQGKTYKKTRMYSLTDSQSKDFKKGNGTFLSQDENLVFSSNEIDPLYFDKLDKDVVDY